MVDRSFSVNERLTFYGLVQYPEYTDKEIAKALKIKVPTVTAIRHRLLSEGLFYNIRIPNLHMLGAELLSVSYNSFGSSVPLQKQMKVTDDLIKDRPEIFFSLIDGKQSLFMQIASNFTAAKRNADDIHEVYTKQNITAEKGLNTYFYPLKTSSLENFFDFGPLLYKTLGIQRLLKSKGLKIDLTSRYPSKKVRKGPKKHIRLRRTEKRVLLGLVAYPDMPDNALSEAIDVSRRTIGRLRHRYEEMGLLKQARVVDLKRLGFSILDLEYDRFNLQLPHGKLIAESLPEGSSIMDSLLKLKPPIFSIRGQVDALALTPHEDFKDLRESNRRFAEILKRYEVYSEEPHRLLYSVMDTEIIKRHNYADITAKILGMELSELKVG